MISKKATPKGQKVKRQPQRGKALRAKQAKVFQQIFKWLGKQFGNFIFDSLLIQSNIKLIFFLLLFLQQMSFQTLFAQNGGSWILKKEEKGVQVFVREVPGSKIKELKFSTVIQSRLSSVAALLLDLQHFDDWSYGSKSTKLVKRISESEFYYHAEIQFPWPMNNRDLVLHSKLTQDEKDYSIVQKISAVKGMVPTSKNRVRIEFADLRWQIKSLPGTKVAIDYLMKTDPGGNLPPWMVNLAADQGPLQTVLRFREMLAQDKFKNAKVSFIAEPD